MPIAHKFVTHRVIGLEASSKSLQKLRLMCSIHVEEVSRIDLVLDIIQNGIIPVG